MMREAMGWGDDESDEGGEEEGDDGESAAL